ncbi:MAG: phosphoenolpyruvate--protein phosphotransferase [Pseudomonadota bacterium]
MVAPIGAPRVLLRRLREIMAEPESPQTRLDRIVVQIAAIMVAEVCSIYLCRKDGSLELFATEGLKPEAVHFTHMTRGEGLVGRIAETAEPMNLSDAQSHPAFSYRPETGEDSYNSFLGVPVLRAGHTLGVLTIQNKARRHYYEEEVEALQTTAMVLAELIISGKMANVEDVAVEFIHQNHLQLNGIPLSEGIALGHVVLHEPRVVVNKLIAEDVALERGRIRTAISKLRLTVDDMLARGDISATGEHRDILETYRMFAYDRGWGDRLHEAVATGLTAEAAIERVQNDTRARMLRQKDPYLRERLHDLDDLSNRLLRILAGKTTAASKEALPDHTILVARHMGAAELLDYDRKKLRGLVLEEGTTSSHVVIVARALGIAAIGKISGAVDKVDTNNAVIVDAITGQFHIRPTNEIIKAYSDKVRFRAKRQEQYKEIKQQPALTLDGKKIDLMVNAGLLVDMPLLEESGADGIGLYRTELQFMVSPTLPRLNAQKENYAKIIQAAQGKPIVFRTLDIGGDKLLPYLRHQKEENPALGWRAVRIGLDRPGLFRRQIRALLLASEGRELRVMLPMISQVSELDAAVELIHKEVAFVKQHRNFSSENLKIGIMIEVPSLLWQLDHILAKVDFVSVGSNDLKQFIFAADRSNVMVNERFDTLSPAFLKVLRQIVLATQKHDVALGLCGEMAGRPLEAMALIGLGFTCLSMAPAYIGPVKSMILSLKAAEIQAYILSGIETQKETLRPALEEFARTNEISI